MTPDLDAIRQRLAKATTGRWRSRESSAPHEYDIVLDDHTTVALVWPRDPAEDVGDTLIGPLRAKWNADLIAHAPTDLADLLALGDQQQARIAALEAALRSLSHEAHGALTLGEHGIRAEIGHTNFTCLRQRVDEALDVLAALASEEP